MKQTYIQPSAEVMNLSGKRAVMETMLIGSDNTTVNTSVDGAQLGREEEDFGGAWDTEW